MGGSSRQRGRKGLPVADFRCGLPSFLPEPSRILSGMDLSREGPAMDVRQDLCDRILEVRTRLYRVAAGTDSLTDAEVLALSTELDALIMEYMRTYCDRLRKPAGP
jgi:hypothetical protein